MGWEAHDEMKESSDRVGLWKSHMRENESHLSSPSLCSSSMPGSMLDAEKDSS